MKGEWSPEAKARHAEAMAARRTAANTTRPGPNPGSPQNRASVAIDRGDTLAELRKAWGIPEKRRL